MSKELWCEMYEKMEREHPKASDAELIALTEQAVEDHMAWTVDQIRDRVKERGGR